MNDPGSNHAYDVVLAPGAERFIFRLARQDAEELTSALLSELENGPNASLAVRFGSGAWHRADGLGPEENAVYIATPLSVGGYTVIHRWMAEAEIERLARQAGGLTAGRGFYVIDILRPESAFRPWPRPL